MLNSEAIIARNETDQAYPTCPRTSEGAGAEEQEVLDAIRHGVREPAKMGRELYKYNLPFNRPWGGNVYAVKQVAPVIREEASEIVVITVYTFYF